MEVKGLKRKELPINGFEDKEITRTDQILLSGKVITSSDQMLLSGRTIRDRLQLAGVMGAERLSIFLVENFVAL